MALSHQQAGCLRVRGAISRVIRTHYHPDERGSASREIALQQSGENKFERTSHSGKHMIRSVRSAKTLPATGPVCLCPVRKGWGGRRDASGTNPPRCSPGRRAHHRPESGRPGPSHTACLCLHCCTAQPHRSAHRHFSTAEIIIL